MRPVLFRIGSYPVYSYGAMLFLAFLVGVLVVRRELKRKGEDPYAVYPVGAVAAIAGLVGSRLFYVLGHLGDFSGNWGALLDLNMRGLVFYGGFFLAVPCCWLAARKMGLRTGVLADAVGLTLPLSLAIARVGCYLNGCCGGKPSGLPWAVTFPGSAVPVHPTQLYEMVLDLSVFVILILVRRRLRRDWDLFLLSVGCYGAVRFLVEFFRFHLRTSATYFFQAISALLAAGCVTLVILRERGAFAANHGEEVG